MQKARSCRQESARQTGKGEKNSNVKKKHTKRLHQSNERRMGII